MRDEKSPLQIHSEQTIKTRSSVINIFKVDRS